MTPVVGKEFLFLTLRLRLLFNLNLLRAASNDLRHAPKNFNLSGDTHALSAVHGFRCSKFVAVRAPYQNREDWIWIFFVEIQKRWLTFRGSRIVRACNDAANGCGLSVMRFGFLRREGTLGI